MHSRLLLSALFYGSLAFLPLASCQFQSRVLNDRTDAFINGLLKEYDSPGGVSIAVVRRNPRGSWVVETKGYGMATLSGSKVTEDTLFAIGSNSKVFVDFPPQHLFLIRMV